MKGRFHASESAKNVWGETGAAKFVTDSGNKLCYIFERLAKILDICEIIS